MIEKPNWLDAKSFLEITIGKIGFYRHDRTFSISHYRPDDDKKRFQRTYTVLATQHLADTRVAYLLEDQDVAIVAIDMPRSTVLTRELMERSFKDGLCNYSWVALDPDDHVPDPYLSHGPIDIVFIRENGVIDSPRIGAPFTELMKTVARRRNVHDLRSARYRCTLTGDVRLLIQGWVNQRFAETHKKRLPSAATSPSP